MKYLLLLFLIGFTAKGQNITVLDSKTKEPIPFTTVVLLQDNKTVYGNYCGQDGTIKIDENKEFDTVEFSCIGYKPKTLNRPEIINIITLDKCTYLLDEVVVSGKNRIETIGYSSMKKYRNSGVGKGDIAAVYIENIYKKPLYIQSFLFTSIGTEIRKAYRLHFYRQGGNTMWPEEEITKESITGFIEMGTKGLVEIDVSGYMIEVPPDGIYAGIEGLGNCDVEGNILPDEKNAGFSYETFYTKNPIYCTQPAFFKSRGWINVIDWLIKDLKISFDAKPSKRDLIVPKFGLKVIVPE